MTNETMRAIGIALMAVSAESLDAHGFVTIPGEGWVGIQANSLLAEWIEEQAERFQHEKTK